MAGIVRLENADAQTLEDINGLLKELSETGSGTTHERLTNVLRNSLVELWVARDGGRIIGMGEVAILMKVARSVAHIESVVVSSSARGKGIGTLIMQKLIERARSLGATEVQLTSRPERVAANRLYQKLGFEQRKTNAYRLDL